MTEEEQIILCQEIMLGVIKAERDGVFLDGPDKKPVMGFRAVVGNHAIGPIVTNPGETMHELSALFHNPEAAIAHGMLAKKQARELLLRIERESERQGVYVHNEIAFDKLGIAFEHINSIHCPCCPKLIDAEPSSAYFGRSPTGYES